MLWTGFAVAVRLYLNRYFYQCENPTNAKIHIFQNCC